MSPYPNQKTRFRAITLRHQIEVFNTTVFKWRFQLLLQHRHFDHLRSNGSMNIVLYLKYQSDPCCNLSVLKNDEHTKIPSSFTDANVYLLLHILVVVEKSV